MNLKLDLLLNFEGSEDELQSFVADIGQLIVEWGYGNQLHGGDVKSLLLINNFSFDTEDEYEEWLQQQIDSGAQAALPVED